MPQINQWLISTCSQTTVTVLSTARKPASVTALIA